ncbi:ABHD17B [Bugula neritina]|uniref:palmitoyl-protein hydrolase n=1 Tax=Bugula neritina TaxID=10212 RepID=A0A7J7JUX0_BUGNE|nr:ABHD17B [Bugula neritina]
MDTYNLHLNDRAEFQYGQKELDCIEVLMTETKAQLHIAMMYVNCAPQSRYTLLFSHGNAVDLGQMSSFFIGLGTRLKCNIFSYDYSGYGVSEGHPTERHLYKDVDAAFHTLLTKYGLSADRIVLYGQSIGTVPTIDLAARHKVAGVVLHSPLMSGMRVTCPNMKRTYCCDSFPSIDKVHKIESPVMVIHGTDDEVIDFQHGLEIYDKTPITVEPLWLEGAGHNDVELYGQYLDRLKKFIDVELPRCQREQEEQSDEQFLVPLS